MGLVMNKKNLLASLLMFSSWSFAERPIFTLTLKEHLFYPSELIIPSNTRIKLIIDNQDETPEQFDSFDLNREKVIFPNNKSIIFVGPLATGEYNFFGEYNPNSAVGKIIVMENTDVN